MIASRNHLFWAVWLISSLALLGYLGYTLAKSTDKRVFMPGPLSPGHHQIELACDACHADAFGGGEVLQEACENCHGHERKKPFDSHPKGKFRDPRNADRLENINALSCLTCHVEHRPEITQKMGLTQPRDLCVHCHQDIAEDRPSHAGMPFTSCRNSGCHNFHDNRALYTDFLIKHLHEPDHKDKAQLPEREFAAVLEELMTYPHDRYPAQALKLSDTDAPPEKMIDAELVGDWMDTAHARSGVNCTACHLADKDDWAWDAEPDHSVCANCHDAEVEGFQRGKHGMRLKAGLSPMRPAMARAAMKQDAHDKELTCLSCHGAHRFDTRQAATEACLGCHDDRHSLAYEGSPHAELWAKEIAGEGPAGSGVSCASCHMPRVDFDANDWLRRILVEHNQNATLSPNEKMARPVCLHCHGLGFTLDALADPKLIDNNFRGRPSVHVRSLEMAEADHQRHLREIAEMDQQEL